MKMKRPKVKKPNFVRKPYYAEVLMDRFKLKDLLQRMI
jgi:hypothetical protein